MKSLFPFLLFLCLYGCFSCTSKTSAIYKGPNIVLIISDDQGWTDYGFMGHQHIETPHIDRLATESLTFTRGYVSAPLCRPSLATIASGLYPHQHGVTGNDPFFIFEGEGSRYQAEWLHQRKPLQDQLVKKFTRRPILPQILSDHGYLTLQTGKWWEGSWKDGFFTRGMTHGDPARGGRHGDEGLKIGREGLQPVFDFIDSAQMAAKPFFVWYAPFLPHEPHTPPKELEDKYLSKAPTPAIARYWAMCEWFDQTIGELLDHLERQNLSKETLIVYVCDNGWIQDPDKGNKFAPRSKRSPYEMGIRTPILFKWPGKIVPALDTTTLIGSIDIAPTILEACHISVPDEMVGLNAMDAEKLKKRSFLFAEAYEHDIADVAVPTQSLQYRIAINYPWKLILPDNRNLPEAAPELFHIARDPHETQNLADEETEKVRTMVKAIEDWWMPF